MPLGGRYRNSSRKEAERRKSLKTEIVICIILDICIYRIFIYTVLFEIEYKIIMILQRKGPGVARNLDLGLESRFI